jgi:multiple sugar transport system substrate-binding protein
MIRKYDIRILLLILILWFLTGCSVTSPDPMPNAKGPFVDHLVKPVETKNADGNQTTLRFWTFHQAKEFEFMESLANQYEKMHPDIKIKVEYIPVEDYFFGTRLISAFASGQGPDIFLVSPGSIKRFVDANVLHPLTSEFTPEITEDFYENALEGVIIHNEIYAVPFEVEILGLYYNTKMFADKGLLPPRTWEEMMEAARVLKDKDKDISGLTIETFGSVYQNFTWLPFLWQTGADVLSADGLNSGLNQPNAVKMYSFFEKMRQEGLLNLYPSRPTNDIGILANGETAMQVSGSWNIRTLESIYKDVPIDVVPLPIPSGGKPATIAGGWKIAVNHQSESVQDATRFVMWAFAEDVENPLKWSSEVKFAYSPRKSVMLAGEDYYTKGLRKVFTDDIFGTEIPEPRLSGEISRIFTESLQNILFNNYDGDSAAQEASEKITSHISSQFKK